MMKVIVQPQLKISSISLFLILLISHCCFSQEKECYQQLSFTDSTIYLKSYSYSESKLNLISEDVQSYDSLISVKFKSQLYWLNYDKNPRLKNRPRLSRNESDLGFLIKEFNSTYNSINRPKDRVTVALLVGSNGAINGCFFVKEIEVNKIEFYRELSSFLVSTKHRWNWKAAKINYKRVESIIFLSF